MTTKQAQSPEGIEDAGGAGPAQKGDRSVVQVRDVVIRFGGDSGDGMQVTGSQFSNTSAIFGNDISTLPMYPAEIRAPAGSIAGVSSFQVHLGSHDVYTPGDACDVLVAMNPAALRVNLPSLKENGIIIANNDAFDKRSLEKARYAKDPREDGSLDRYQVFSPDIVSMTRESVRETMISHKDADRCKNFFALGLTYWLFRRPLAPTLRFIERKYGKLPVIAEAITLAFKAGYNYAENADLFRTTYEVPPAELEPGLYRNITGNEALVLGMIAAGKQAGLNVFLASYPITPASTILHGISNYRNYGVTTVQAEDEIAAVCMAIGAAFSGQLAFTTTSGPGMCLKAEAMGLAVITELPLVVCDIQRGGPSTGLPTSAEQSDLLIALFGRHGESPMPVVAARSPSDCFDVIIEASRIATKYLTPVVLLSDGNVANSAEPWRIPDVVSLPRIDVSLRTDPEGFYPYLRDPDTLARPWVVPGTPGLEHRIGGLEKENITGNVSYDPKNHELMSRLRAEKIQRIEKDIPPSTIEGPEVGSLLIVGWGSTYGAIRAACEKAREDGKSVSHLHLRYLNPLPPDLGDIFKRFKSVLVPEMNLGQLSLILRGRLGVEVRTLSKMQGRPFEAREIEAAIDSVLGGQP